MKHKATYRIFAIAVLFALIVIQFISSSQIHTSHGKLSYASSAQFLSANVDSEIINFSSREDEYYNVPNDVPLYYQMSTLANSCGPTAGAMIIGYYDKYYEELIPNYTSYFPATGNYKGTDGNHISTLTENLYVLMRTNIDDVGVGETDCLNGLKAYVNNKGRTLKYETVKDKSTISESAYLQAINQNRPIILFGGVTDIYLFSSSSDHDIFVKSTVSGNHIYVGFGYYRVRYYSNGTNFRTDTYLRVACGLVGYLDAFIRVSSTTSSITNDWFINGYSVSIT